MLKHVSTGTLTLRKKGSPTRADTISINSSISFSSSNESNTGVDADISSRSSSSTSIHDIGVQKVSKFITLMCITLCFERYLNLLLLCISLFVSKGISIYYSYIYHSFLHDNNYFSMVAIYISYYIYVEWVQLLFNWKSLKNKTIKFLM